MFQHTCTKNTYAALISQTYSVYIYLYITPHILMKIRTLSAILRNGEIYLFILSKT